MRGAPWRLPRGAEPHQEIGVDAGVIVRVVLYAASIRPLLPTTKRDGWTVGPTTPLAPNDQDRLFLSPRLLLRDSSPLPLSIVAFASSSFSLARASVLYVLAPDLFEGHRHLRTGRHCTRPLGFLGSSRLRVQSSILAASKNSWFLQFSTVQHADLKILRRIKH